MTQIPLHLKEIWATPEEARQPCLDLLVQILSNVINNPNEPKYRDMNFSKIRVKFKPCPSALFYLFDAGFSQSFDGSRLQFENQNWSMLEKAWDALNRKLENPNTPPPPDPAEKAKVSNVKTATTASENKTEEKEQNKDNDKEQGKDGDAIPAEETFDDAQLPTGLSVDDLDLLKQIQSHKDTTVRLSNKELEGKTREEKLKILDEKRRQFREEKSTAVVKNEISREKQRRENAKSAQEAQRKREEYQRRMLADRKKRENDDARKRKQAIREKIKEDKERRQQQKKLDQTQAQSQSQPKQ